MTASVGERSCDSPATKLTRKLQKSRRQAVEIQTKLNSRKAEEIDTRMQIVQLWSKIKKAIETNRVPCHPLCKCMFPAERDVQWFFNATQAMIKKIDKEAAERRIQNWLSKMKRVLSRKQAPRMQAKIGRHSQIHQERKSSTDHCGCWYQIKKITSKELNQLRKIPELTGRDLKRKAKEISSMRSVAMCGWRTQEIKALPEEIFDLFACLFKRVEESQIWPEILVQVVTTFIP